jgi:hypothetical protein
MLKAVVAAGSVLLLAKPPAYVLADLRLASQPEASRTWLDSPLGPYEVYDRWGETRYMYSCTTTTAPGFYTNDPGYQVGDPLEESSRVWCTEFDYMTPDSAVQIRTFGSVTHALYMEPSDFGYAGLTEQREGGENSYDNFLRSNIDNQQDERDFQTEAGRDHLPFRSFEAATTDISDTVAHKIPTLAGTLGPAIFVDPGEPYIIPLRWNNPHASELEVNIWIARNGQTDAEFIVVPIRKPTCAGEGRQDNAFAFTVPLDFNTNLKARVPGFGGCNEPGDCVLQVYAHSVETRTYAIGTPIVVTGGEAATATELDVDPAGTDVGLDICSLQRSTCLATNDPSADITSAVPRRARLVSDQFNHAFQDSDFSPYSGQQPEAISRNLQAACIIKMVTRNRGELGRSLGDPTAVPFVFQLRKTAEYLVDKYEEIANEIIEAIGNDMGSSATVPSTVPPSAWIPGVDPPEGDTPNCMGPGDYCPLDDCDPQEFGDARFCPGPSCIPADLYPCPNCDATEWAQCKAKIIAGLEYPLHTPQRMSSYFRAMAEELGYGHEECFRCAEVGSVNALPRLTTHTYVPSFSIPDRDGLVERAKAKVPSQYTTMRDTIENDHAVLIYETVLSNLHEQFLELSTRFGLGYVGPQIKTTPETMSTPTQFRKVRQEGAIEIPDDGSYAATEAQREIQPREQLILTANSGAVGGGAAVPADFTAPDIDGPDGPLGAPQPAAPQAGAPQPSVGDTTATTTIEVPESTFGPLCQNPQRSNLPPGSSLSSASSSSTNTDTETTEEASMGAGGIAFIVLLCGLGGFGAYTIFSRRSQVKGLKVEKDEQQEARDTFTNMLVRNQGMGTVCMFRASLGSSPNCAACCCTSADIMMRAGRWAEQRNHGQGRDQCSPQGARCPRSGTRKGNHCAV